MDGPAGPLGKSKVTLPRLARPVGSFVIVGPPLPGVPGLTTAGLAPSGTNTTKRSPIVTRRGDSRNWLATSRPRLGSPKSSPAVWQVSGRKYRQGLRAAGPRIGTRLSLRAIALTVVPLMASYR